MSRQDYIYDRYQISDYFLSWKACIHPDLSPMTGPSKDCRIYCHIYGKDPCPGMLFYPSDSILLANSGQHF